MIVCHPSHDPGHDISVSASSRHLFFFTLPRVDRSSRYVDFNDGLRVQKPVSRICYRPLLTGEIPDTHHSVAFLINEGDHLLDRLQDSRATTCMIGCVAFLIVFPISQGRLPLILDIWCGSSDSIYSHLDLPVIDPSDVAMFRYSFASKDKANKAGRWIRKKKHGRRSFRTKIQDESDSPPLER